jgi:predicted Ser/Thr protein kinase
VADWRGLENRGWQLEDWGVERQELSGGDNHGFHAITHFRREFLTGTRLERASHGFRLHRLVSASWQ